MIAKRGRLNLLLALGILGGLLVLAPAPAQAQFGDELFEEEEYFEEEDPFRESDEFGQPVDDFTEGGDFVEEEALPPEERLTLGSRRRELQLLGERDLLPLNAAWGAGTGLVIGGWFALINQGTSRQTQRSLGLGVVLGTVLGVLVGARSLVAPESPTADASSHPARGGYPTAPVAMPDSIHAPQVSRGASLPDLPLFHMTWRF